MINQIVKYIETGIIDEEKINSFIDEMIHISKDDLVGLIKYCDIRSIDATNIPQYSTYEDGTYNMLQYLRMSGDFGPRYAEIGSHYLDNNQNKDALVKYGENHSKLASLLGLVRIKKCGRVSRVYLSELGKRIERMENQEQIIMISRLSVGIPIIGHCIKHDVYTVDQLYGILLEYLTEVTATRRRKNTWDILRLFREG